MQGPRHAKFGALTTPGRGGRTRTEPRQCTAVFTRLLPPSPCSLLRRPRGPPSPAPPGGDDNLRLRCGDGDRRQGPRWPDGERWRRSGGGRGEAERGGEAAAQAAAGIGAGGRPWPGPGPDVLKREARDADEPLSFSRWEEEEDEGPERPLPERYMMAPVARGSRGSSGAAPPAPGVRAPRRPARSRAGRGRWEPGRGGGAWGRPHKMAAAGAPSRMVGWERGAAAGFGRAAPL